MVFAHSEIVRIVHPFEKLRPNWVEGQQHKVKIPLLQNSRLKSGRGGTKKTGHLLTYSDSLRLLLTYLISFRAFYTQHLVSNPFILSSISPTQKRSKCLEHGQFVFALNLKTKYSISISSKNGKMASFLSSNTESY